MKFKKAVPAATGLEITKNENACVSHRLQVDGGKSPTNNFDHVLGDFDLQTYSLTLILVT